jgi:hypothetical protein
MADRGGLRVMASKQNIFGMASKGNSVGAAKAVFAKRMAE